MAVPTFVDRVTLHVSAGRGGHGVASVHREKFKPLGGPDGHSRRALHLRRPRPFQRPATVAGRSLNSGSETN